MKPRTLALAALAAATLAAGVVVAQTEPRRQKDDPATCVVTASGAGYCDGTFHRFRHSGSDRQDVSFVQLPDGTRNHDKQLIATKIFQFRYDAGVPLVSGGCFVPEAWMIGNPEAAAAAQKVTAADVQVDLAGLWPQAMAHTGRFRITWDQRLV